MKTYAAVLNGQMFSPKKYKAISAGEGHGCISRPSFIFNKRIYEKMPVHRGGSRI
jgi:hypothetical protein